MSNNKSIIDELNVLIDILIEKNRLYELESIKIAITGLKIAQKSIEKINRVIEQSFTY